MTKIPSFRAKAMKLSRSALLWLKYRSLNDWSTAFWGTFGTNYTNCLKEPYKEQYCKFLRP